MDKRNEEIMDNDVLIEMTDEEGNVFYYVQEMIIPVGDENFAMLVEVKDDDEHEHDCECGCDCDCDDGVIIAKIIINEDGEEEFIEPTDEEFERVQEAYEKILDEEE